MLRLFRCVRYKSDGSSGHHHWDCDGTIQTLLSKIGYDNFYCVFALFYDLGQGQATRRINNYLFVLKCWTSINLR